MKVPDPVFYAVVIILVAGLVAIYIADLPPDPERLSSGNRCDRYLGQLYKGLQIYVARFGNNHLYPPHRGEMVWLCLTGQCGDTQQHPPDYFQNAPLRGLSELLACPSSSNHSNPTDYRGPRQILSDDLPSDLPIGADKPANHRGGGNILRFDGSVGFRTDGDYEAALKQVE
jgi:prepilin-type processing-associated H-X9-DG protein